MKNSIIQSIKILTVSLLYFSATSCVHEILDTEPVRYISDNASITDEKSANAALFGLYNKLQHTNYYGGAGFQGNIFLAGGDGVWTGTWDYLNHFVTHSYLSDNLSLYNSWLPIYSTVNQANHIIAKVPGINDPGFTEAKRSTVLGEALFVRALAYFDLARTWGNVPVVLQPTSSVNDFAGVKQSTQTQVYQQILSDLEQAEGLLPNSLNRNRATRRTAQAFRARVHLYNKEWEKAEQYASLLISNTDYELITWDVFLKGVGTKESVFELAFSTADASAHYSNWTNPAGRAQWAPSRQLFELLSSPVTGGARKSLIVNGSNATRIDYYIQQLWWRPAGDNPTYILRIAEQYLIRAEARVKKNNPDLTGALADLNAVRKRSDLPEITVSSPDEILLAIENERRAEFAFEPHRWFDLVRTGRAGSVLGVTDSNKWIFPIPFNDIKADPDLVQNPGY
jgi:tetratricopeptide (TPR) repeat protein